MIKKYLFYLIRWQLSTPILAVVLILLSNMNTILATVIANLIGGLIFFWVDRFIFKTITKNPLWEIKDDVECFNCGKVGRGYRIVEWFKYNRRQDKRPEYRCESCKDLKQEMIENKINKKKSRRR
ncbi:MAG: hypothetical protein FWD34_06110 [Oscillospiraceae bacterium]|nr:hypothetical protein [Oscillospiraceae bacterium]